MDAALQRKPDSRHRNQRDEESEAEVNVVHRCLAGRLWEMHTVPAKEPVKRVLALHNEVCDGTMEKSYDKPEHEPREIHYHAWSLAIVSVVSIGRSA